MKEIGLANGGTTMVDDSDFEWLSKISWRRRDEDHTSYVYTVKRYRLPDRKIKYKYILMHRLILGLTDPSVLTDHINHNGLDNRRGNLRPCTHSENLRNRRPFKMSKKS